jgi:cyanophycinase
MNQHIRDRIGPLIAIGGAEDKTSERRILARVLESAPEDRRAVGIVTTASQIPDEIFPQYDAAFTELGASEVVHLDIRSREDAADAAMAARIEGLGVVFISGGDQLRLTHVFGGSAVLEAIRAHRLRGGVVAGTSAGAAAMSSTMIYNGAAADALRKGAVKMAAGLGFVDWIVIDSHFLERGRFTRLMEVGATNPEFLGIGIGEDAAVEFHDGEILEAIGNGHVIVVDSSHLKSSNVAALSDGEPVAVEHVVMHALTEGCGYQIRERRFLSPDGLNTAKEGESIADLGAESAQGT